jgi:cytidine deaminase
MNQDALRQAAQDAAKLGYTPYSHFPVGAAILMRNGTIIQGANIENSSFGLTVCAERNALFRAHLEGYRADDMVAMAVFGLTHDPISPCGACRQVMSELLHAHTPVYLLSESMESKDMTVETLLPYAFDGSALPKAK